MKDQKKEWIKKEKKEESNNENKEGKKNKPIIKYSTIWLFQIKLNAYPIFETQSCKGRSVYTEHTTAMLVKLAPIGSMKLIPVSNSILGSSYKTNKIQN